MLPGPSQPLGLCLMTFSAPDSVDVTARAPEYGVPRPLLLLLCPRSRSTEHQHMERAQPILCALTAT